MRDIEKTNIMLEIAMSQEQHQLQQNQRVSTQNQRYRSRLSGTTRTTNFDSGSGFSSEPNLSPKQAMQVGNRRY